jgi:uncharacterized membrane protein YecN with MAPEG domain
MHPNFIIITSLYAAVLGLLFAGLTVNVIVNRVKLGVDIGDGGKGTMLQACRAHANFAEHVPMALLLILLAELIGSPPAMIHGLAAVLVFARLASAYGLLGSTTQSPGRKLGAGLTVLVDVVASGLIVFRAVAMMSAMSGA